MSRRVVIDHLPPCDLCGTTARYDAKTSDGPWAYLCERHWRRFRASPALGTGQGQRLVVSHEDYQPGDRVELISTADPYTRLRPGARGTVTSVDDLGTVHVSWDSGARLGLVPGEDKWRRVGP